MVNESDTQEFMNRHGIPYGDRGSTEYRMRLARKPEWEFKAMSSPDYYAVYEYHEYKDPMLFHTNSMDEILFWLLANGLMD